MSYKVNTKRVLGIDPGIANTGLAIVSLAKAKYRLLHAERVKTSPEKDDAVRLLEIFEAVADLSRQFDLNSIAIERVFHNQNVSSSITTGKVIGAVEVAAALRGIPTLELTPQQIKSTSGLGSQASKADMQAMMCRILDQKRLNPHVADACGAAIAGCLRSVAWTQKNAKKEGGCL